MSISNTEIGTDRRRVDALIGQLPGRDREDRTFDQPWELRAVAIAIAAHHNGNFDWSEFQLALIQSIKRWEEDAGNEPWSYFEHWLTALEAVLTTNGLLSEAALDQRTREVLAIPRDTGHHQARREPIALSPAAS